MEKFISDHAVSTGIKTDPAIKQLMSRTGGIAMGRIAGPDEVASPVHFLVSPSAGYLTGANHAIDGGLLPVV